MFYLENYFLYEPINDHYSSSYTIQTICNANKLTGFYMMGNIGC